MSAGGGRLGHPLNHIREILPIVFALSCPIPCLLTLPSRNSPFPLSIVSHPHPPSPTSVRSRGRLQEISGGGAGRPTAGALVEEPREEVSPHPQVGLHQDEGGGQEGLRLNKGYEEIGGGCHGESELEQPITCRVTQGTPSQRGDAAGVAPCEECSPATPALGNGEEGGRGRGGAGREMAWYGGGGRGSALGSCRRAMRSVRPPRKPPRKTLKTPHSTKYLAICLSVALLDDFSP